MKNRNKKSWRRKGKREDRRRGRNIQIWVEFIFCLSQSSKLSSFSSLFPSFFFPAFPFMIPSVASIGNPPVSYYSSVVRHCAHRTKHHGDSPAALFARNIWQYPNERLKRQPGKKCYEGR